MVTELVLDLAGERFALASQDSRWGAVLAPRYGSFAVPAGARGEGAVDFFVDVTATAGAPADWSALAALLAEAAPAERGATGLRLVARSYEVELDLAARRARVAGPLHRAPVDQLLRVALPLLLAGSGLVLHGALVTDGARGWLCCGPSGSGKSTLARLLPDMALCDELASARRGDAGWTAASLPYWHARPGEVRLAGVCLLRHGHRHELRPLSPRQALRALSHEVQWPLLAAAADPVLGSLVRLVEEVPVAELHFLPRADVAAVLVAGWGT